MRPILLIAFLLSGCATDLGSKRTSWLCYQYWKTKDYAYYEELIVRRGYTCTAQDIVLEQRERSIDAQYDAAVLNAFIKANPPVQQVKPIINCTATEIGNTTYTNCR